MQVEVDEEGPIVGGRIEAPDENRVDLQGKRFVFTAAQSNTNIHEEFFESLLKFCEHTGAELCVARFTYNKSTHGRKSVKPGSEKSSDHDEIWFDPRLDPYWSDVSAQVADGLVFCGELNILPTVVNPLSSLKNYTRSASGIVPHPKIALQSIPTMKHAPSKFMYTTGAVTQRNYIQKRAGQVADFHHVFGALSVEIDNTGQWHARHLIAGKDGTFYDLDKKYNPDYWSGGYAVEAVTHGDIHLEKFEESLFPAIWGDMMPLLRPREQHFHDIIDFSARNHHNIKDPHFLVAQRTKNESVESEIRRASEFLDRTWREGCESVVVESNHDRALMLWLKNSAAHLDPANAPYWHKLNSEHMRNLSEGVEENVFETQLRRGAEKPFKFVQEDESHVILDHLGGIECGLHGHLGPNGARGSALSFNQIGRRVNTAHSHSAGILQGVYTAGVLGKLDMGYNRGPSSWSHSSIVTYPNGKRTIITFKNGRFRA